MYIIHKINKIIIILINILILIINKKGDETRDKGCGMSGQCTTSGSLISDPKAVSICDVGPFITYRSQIPFSVDDVIEWNLFLSLFQEIHQCAVDISYSNLQRKGIMKLNKIIENSW